MPENSVKITLDAVDKTKAAFDQLQRNLSLIKWDAIVNLGQKAMQAGRQLIDFLDIGAKAAQVGDAFRAVAIASGVMADELIDNMKKTSGVFVDETEIMILAQRALVEKLDPEQIVKLMESARVAARLMGTDVKASFDMIMESVISMRTRGLRAAFPMEEETIFERYATSIGATKEDLSEWGKRQALVKEILRQTEERLRAIGPLLQTNAEKIQTAKSAWQELTETLSKAAAEGGELISKIGIDMTASMEKLPEKARGAFFKTTDELLAYSKRMAEETQKISALKEVTPPEPGWIQKWVKDFDGLKYSFEQLEIISEQKLRETADAAIKYVAVIRNAFNQGKATVKDLANAITAANEAMKKVTGEDPTKKLVDLEIETQKKIAAISFDDPDRQRKINEIIDDWQRIRTMIQEAARPNLDITMIEGQFNEIHDDYKRIKQEIESSPIKIKVDASELTKLQTDANKEVESTIQFMGEGSTRRPISDKIREIIQELGGMDNALAGMGAMINFSEMTMQMGKLQTQLTQIQSIVPTLHRMVNATAGIWRGVDPNYLKQIQDAESAVTGQMGILQMKMLMEIFRGMGMEGFQTGGIVPRTGLYKLHEGERVLTTNQISMGGQKIEIIINGNRNPRATVDELVKTLKYHLRGELKDLLQ